MLARGHDNAAIIPPHQSLAMVDVAWPRLRYRAGRPKGLENRGETVSLGFPRAFSERAMNLPVRARLSFGVFLVALVTLMVELLLIRVFDVVLVNNLGYMIISCALFAFGLSGVYATLRPLKDPAKIHGYLAGLSVILAAACIVQMPLLNFNPLDLHLVADTPMIQAVYFFFMYLTVTLPFFFSGLILARVFSVYATEIRKLYFFDLVGAAIGAVIVVPLMRPLGPGGLLLVATGLALIAAGLFQGRTRYVVLINGCAEWQRKTA
jgi:hypothetical protein